MCICGTDSLNRHGWSAIKPEGYNFRCWPLQIRTTKEQSCNGTVSAPVYMENKAPLQQAINLIGSGLQKREVSGSVTWEN